MPYGVYLSAAGAQTQSHRMEVLSNNLANVDTPGYKPQETILQSRFAELIEQGQVTPGQGGIDDLGGGVTVQESETQFKMGPIEQTGRKTDFAIHGEDAFFAIQRNDETLLTRAGNFLFDSSGTMITPEGDKVLGTNGKPIQLAPGVPYEVVGDGQLRQGGAQFEIMLAKPKNLGDLAHAGGNMFKPLAEFDLVPAAERNVVAGAIEHSAVSPTGAMMELIQTSRAYEANVQMIKNQDSVLGTLIGRMLQS